MSYYSAKPAMSSYRRVNPSAAPWLLLLAATVGAGVYLVNTQKSEAKPKPKTGGTPEPDPDPEPEPSVRIRSLSDADLQDKIQVKRMADTRRPVVAVALLCDIPQEAADTIMGFYERIASKPEAEGVDFYVVPRTANLASQVNCPPEMGAAVTSMRMSGLNVQYIAREVPNPAPGNRFGSVNDPTVESVLTEAIDFAIGTITPANHTEVPLDVLLP